MVLIKLRVVMRWVVEHKTPLLCQKRCHSERYYLPSCRIVVTVV
jgi:hypothetical protein